MGMNGKRIMSWIKSNLAKNLAAVFFGILISILMIEIFLRFYNPLGFRVKSGKIIIYPYKKYIIGKTSLRGVNGEVIHTKNSLGFRGQEPPKDFSSYLTIIAVGGSTTEGFYLSDGKTWPEQLEKKLFNNFHKIWINNAGFDGQSSYGHLIFTQDYLSKIKPKVAVFYCGLNDVGISAMNRYDGLLAGHGESSVKKIVNFSARHSELFSLLVNLSLYFSSKKTGITHANVDPLTAKRDTDIDSKNSLIQEEMEQARAYAERLSKIVKICRENGIEPVFISQASLCKKSRDLATGVDLGDIAVQNKFKNCEYFGKALDVYNLKMKEIAQKEKVFFIDGANLMPIDSSLYYDLFHFNDRGAEVFAEKIYPQFSAFLRNRYNII